MKKMILPLLAALLAIGLSAFTEPRPFTTLEGWDGVIWHTFDATYGCPNNGTIPCTVDNPNTEMYGDLVDVYTQRNFHDSYRVKYAY